MDAEEAAVSRPLLLGSKKGLQACKYRIKTERQQHQEAIQVHADQCEIIGIYVDGADGEWSGGSECRQDCEQSGKSTCRMEKVSVSLVSARKLTGRDGQSGTAAVGRIFTILS